MTDTETVQHRHHRGAKGVRPGGPIQMVVECRAAVLARADKPDQALLLMEFLTTPEARRAFAATGVKSPQTRR